MMGLSVAWTFTKRSRSLCLVVMIIRSRYGGVYVVFTVAVVYLVFVTVNVDVDFTAVGVTAVGAAVLLHHPPPPSVQAGAPIEKLHQLEVQLIIYSIRFFFNLLTTIVTEIKLRVTETKLAGLISLFPENTINEDIM